MSARRGFPGIACIAVAVLVGGCAQSPEREASAPSIVPLLPRLAEDPVLARDSDYVVVVAQPGDDLARLAERWTGDAKRRDAIAEFNRIDEVRPGQAVAIPRKRAPATGIRAGAIQAVTILCYHRFGPRGNTLTVTPAAFESQLAWLAKNGYSVVSLERLPAFLEGREPLPKKSVVITIDDGYRSTYDIAYPLLRKHGYPATVFLYSDFVGAPDALTWSQMKEMTASGLIDIQPHSKTHSNLTLRAADESEPRYRERIRREIEAPVDTIRSHLGARSLAYAFPYGDVNDVVVGELRSKGVALGVTVTPGGNAFYAPPYMLRRTMIFGGDDLDAFRAKVVSSLPFARP